MRYVIDSRYYRGSAVAVFSDDAHNDSEPGETLEMLQQRCKNPHLTAVTPERLAFLQRRYRRSLQEPFREIGREEYYRLYNAMPPLRSVRNERFFAGEAYLDDLHLFCFRLAGRYFAAVRSTRLNDRELKDHPESGYVDFYGNVCEYSAAFHYRIYSRELFRSIIDRLRTVKRHQAWYR